MSIVTDLERILADEQQMLLSGDYSGLEKLAARKLALAARLEVDGPDLSAEKLESLAELATRNETLLESARRGIQAAMTQLAQFTNGEHQSTYSREGERRPLSRSPSSMTQKL